MKIHTKNFLEYLLEEATCNEKENETPTPEDESIADCTVDDFSPEFVRMVEGFIDGFISFLNKKEFDMDRLDYLDRSFGGNIYLSLSGAGAGFFDEYGDPDKTLGDELQSLIKEYSGSSHRFEELSYSLSKNEKGELDLVCVIPGATNEYRNRTFNVESKGMIAA